jgi:hypothetical protein
MLTEGVEILNVVTKAGAHSYISIDLKKEAIK